MPDASKPLPLPILAVIGCISWWTASMWLLLWGTRIGGSNASLLSVLVIGSVILSDLAAFFGAILAVQLQASSDRLKANSDLPR